MEQKISLDPRAKMRLRWTEHYEKVSKKVLCTCRYFGISGGTFYLWYHRYMVYAVRARRPEKQVMPPAQDLPVVPQDVMATILMLRQQRHYGPGRMSSYVKEKFKWFVSKKPSTASSTSESSDLTGLRCSPTRTHCPVRSARPSTSSLPKSKGSTPMPRSSPHRKIWLNRYDMILSRMSSLELFKPLGLGSP